jgi:hypothetical protein
MSRSFMAAVTAACVAFAPCALVLESAQAEPVTVKSSKSNTSDRMGGGGGVRAGGVARTTTVKSSKSNTSDRMGGGGGRGSGALDKAINLNSSRSNSNY